MNILRKKTLAETKSPKLLNRPFALFFALIMLAWMWFLVIYGPAKPPVDMITEFQNIPRILAIFFAYSTFLLGFPIIFIGLVYEFYKPSLDFTFHRDKKWIFMSIILFVVFILFNIIMWYWNKGQGPFGQPLLDYLPIFITETSFLSLMFGILFLTYSTPRKSLSYSIILVGTVLIEISIFSIYPMYIIGSATIGIFISILFTIGTFLLVQQSLKKFPTKSPFYIMLIGTILLLAWFSTPIIMNFVSEINNSMPQYKNFWTETIYTPWFWLDLTSEIVIFVGALWLLVKGKVDSKL